MANEIKSIDDQVRALVENIKKLQDEIKTYQSGYKAFETASAALGTLAKEQSGLTGAVAESLKELEKVDAVAIMKRIDATAEKLAETVAMVEALARRLDYDGEIAGLREQNEQIVKRLDALNVRLNEGVKVKKKRWFA